MKFEVSYRSGTTHDVELAASVAVLGRDPSCDVVLNDTKCSRRHATVEEGPGGLFVRDAGSANGTYVNGRRVREAPVHPGDTIRVGDVNLKLLPQVAATVVVAPDDVDAQGLGPEPDPSREPGPFAPRAEATPVPRAEPAAHPRPARRPLPPPRQEDSAASLSYSSARDPAAWQLASTPLTITLLTALWALAVPASVAGILLVAGRLDPGALGWTAAGALALAAAGFSAAMVVGLRTLAPWARHLQIATAAVGLVVCPVTLACAAVLLYLTRPEVRRTFERGRRGDGRGAGSAEPTFALSILTLLLAGFALSGIAALLLRLAPPA